MSYNSNYCVLGISFGGHDTAASITVNGILIAAAAEERFNGEKHTRAFPINAIKECLKISKLKISEIDEIAGTSDIRITIRETYLKPAIIDDKRLDFLFNDFEKLKIKKDRENIFRKKLNYNGKVTFHRHHLCHIASSYYPSGFKKALCYSIDGMGEYETSLMALVNNGNIKILHDKNLYPNSLGLAYSAITFFLGWRHHCDEGIIMGLAPYGNPDAINEINGRSYISIFRDIIKVKSSLNVIIDTDYLDYFSKRDKWVNKKFIEVFGKPRKYDNPLNQHHKNIAAALQKRLEEIVLNQLRYIKKIYKVDYLCLSGGVGLNCSLNGKIAKSKIFKEIFVQPASGDDGCSYGACLLSHKIQSLNYTSKRFFNFYQGSRYSNSQILKFLIKLKIDYDGTSNIYKKTAKYLSEGKIVAWFQDSSEFGPRALGNRSILCKPFPLKMKDYLNKRVKFREEFRPFAPAVLKEFQKEYFDLNQDSYHMLIACKVKKNKKDKIPAVVHVDDTCRVQTVTNDSNSKFFSLLNEFYNLTKVPVLLNTSFNVKGQPIVNDPETAIKTFKKTNIDILVIGKFILTKS